MSRREEQSLAARREELVARSGEQRRALIAAVGPFTRKAAAFDRILAKVREHPVLTAAGIGAVALLSGRRLVSLATRVLTIYALIRR